MVGQSHYLFAALEGERLVREQGITALPVDPFAVARSLGILVEPKPASARGVSGMLIRYGEEYAIAYATHIDNEGFKRFSVAHELGHYRLPGHVDALFAEGDVHESRAGFVSQNPYELEADHFAAGFLMPDPMVSHELRRLADGMQAVEGLATACCTSLTTSAIRYVEKASVPVAMVMSAGDRIDYSFMSKPLQDFDGLTWPRKAQPLPAGVETERFNRDSANVRTARRAESETDLRDWFGGRRPIPATEEIIGLGSYGRTLTILSSEILADEEDEDDDLEERWTPRFRR